MYNENFSGLALKCIYESGYNEGYSKGYGAGFVAAGLLIGGYWIMHKCMKRNEQHTETNKTE